MLNQLPLIRICELQSDYGDYASDNPLTLTFDVQVDIWVESLTEADALYYPIDELMRENEWSCVYSELTTDSDLKESPRIIKRYEAIRTIEFE